MVKCRKTAGCLPSYGADNPMFQQYTVAQIQELQMKAKDKHSPTGTCRRTEMNASEKTESACYSSAPVSQSS